MPGMDSWRTISPLKLAEMRAFTLPLPSYLSIPAMANGSWSFPVRWTPSWANRYVPCSVASEHFDLAPFSSSANPVPTACAPTTPTTANTNRVATYLLMRSVPPRVVGAYGPISVFTPASSRAVPHITSAAYSCERGGRIPRSSGLSSSYSAFCGPFVERHYSTEATSAASGRLQQHRLYYLRM